MNITIYIKLTCVEICFQVSEEYKLQANTFYLIVYLIDWFLSKNYIIDWKLLGITCKLHANCLVSSQINTDGVWFIKFLVIYYNKFYIHFCCFVVAVEVAETLAVETHVGPTSKNGWSH